MATSRSCGSLPSCQKIRPGPGETGRYRDGPQSPIEWPSGCIVVFRRGDRTTIIVEVIVMSSASCDASDSSVGRGTICTVQFWRLIRQWVSNWSRVGGSPSVSVMLCVEPSVSLRSTRCVLRSDEINSATGIWPHASGLQTPGSTMCRFTV